MTEPLALTVLLMCMAGMMVAIGIAIVILVVVWLLMLCVKGGD